ncbi:MAG: TlpA family protein disulfide reductase [Bacteroidetes bacterium]|uniref:TlpA family protein disulfide reductase n=1 Tax=Phnomibacter sp. TaxID=2836217 RepID=UPI002FDD7B66|nr:TlpA family protein disulfide reductase [Bacteroidota bacterium]
MKKSIISLVLSLNFAICISQPLDYIIEGYVSNVDSGMIYIVPVINEAKYYGPNSMKDSAIIKDGLFKFRRIHNNNNTYAYRLYIQSNISSGSTDFVFINGENVFIEIDSIDEHISPKIANSTYQNEIKYEYNDFFEKFIVDVNRYFEYEEGIYNKFDGNIPKEIVLEFEAKQKLISHQSDSLFQLYAELHPNSHVTLWKMIERLKNIGHNSSYRSIFNKFPVEIRNSQIGLIFLQDLYASELLSINSVFPELQFQNIQEEITVIDKSKLGSSFTLVDFWFTDCIPCRKQFPELKRLFKIYRQYGFQIIGISIDEESKIDTWRNLIQKESLNWLHLLDKSGKTTTKLAINSFPTNFLLNSDGVILKKNITISDLATLLLESYKKIGK